MKQYKLIKEYPGSPNLGANAFSLQPPYYIAGTQRMHKTEVENFPEFWEDVKGKPLFTTEDGVDMYKGDGYYRLNLKTWTIYFTSAFTEIKDTYSTYHETNKEFSTEEAAEEYILMNKPCLSIEDICKEFEYPPCVITSLSILKKLVKSKLK